MPRRGRRSSCSPSWAEPTRVALGLEYDGSAFAGWQTQPGGGTVQDAVEAALSRVADGPIGVTCAGRTDSGVHAIQQVIHFDTAAQRPDTAWVRGTNASLPAEVAVLWSRVVDPEFHARYSAIARTYRYRLLNRASRPGLEAKRIGWFHRPLELAPMREAARLLVGEHDFSAFRSAECQAKTPVRTLHALDVEGGGERIDFVLRANAFLHHMVRNLVGTLLYVGKGKRAPQWVREVLESRDRGRAAPTFGPAGLYLEKVEYEPKWGLPQ